MSNLDVKLRVSEGNRNSTKTKVTSFLGFRMSKPHDCPDEIYELMLSCWNADPSKRPQFSQILEGLNELYQFLKSPSENSIIIEKDEDESYYENVIKSYYEL